MAPFTCKRHWDTSHISDPREAVASNLRYDARIPEQWLSRRQDVSKRQRSGNKNEIVSFLNCILPPTAGLLALSPHQPHVEANVRFYVGSRWKRDLAMTWVTALSDSA